jgi:hypothetical protein
LTGEVCRKHLVLARIFAPTEKVIQPIMLRIGPCE